MMPWPKLLEGEMGVTKEFPERTGVRREGCIYGTDQNPTPIEGVDTLNKPLEEVKNGECWPILSAEQC